jgi:ABC-type multidrug transport system fused ATPase/permease subunit
MCGKEKKPVQLFYIFLTDREIHSKGKDILNEQKFMKKIRGLAKKYLKSFLYFYRRLGYRIFIRMGLSICVGVLDGFGLAMFLPLLKIADDSISEEGEGLGKLEFLVEGMEALGLSFNLLTILVIMSIFFILKGVAQYVNGIYNVILKQFFIKTIRIDLSNALSAMSYKAFAMADAGRIQNTLSGEVLRLSKAYLTYFGAFQKGILVAVYISFAFLIDTRFAILICVGGWLTNFIYQRIYRATKLASKKLTKGLNSYQGLILQFVTYFKYLKATGYIQDYNEKLKGSINDIENQNRRIGKLGAVVNAIREPILVIVVSVVILVQVNLLNGSLGTILVSLLFFYRALSALMAMQVFYNDFLAVSGSMDNLTQMEKKLKRARELDGEVAINSFQDSISLKDVSFSFGDVRILKNINIEIKKNHTIAFVGDSGSGKTTLINIISGLIPVGSGQLLIDGIDSFDLNKRSYQRRIGYITQEPVVFSDTIFNNVTFWAEPTPETLERFNRAVERASIREFIYGLPDKENTVLGNNGINLSGGQKQRISIARELYKEVDILVLDEATSSLDSETEEAIQKGMEKLRGSYTIIMVAHRLSTIKQADNIVIMSNGEVAEVGNFETLVSRSSKFQKMVELQEV